VLNLTFQNVYYLLAMKRNGYLCENSMKSPVSTKSWNVAPTCPILVERGTKNLRPVSAENLMCGPVAMSTSPRSSSSLCYHEEKKKEWPNCSRIFTASQQKRGTKYKKK